MKRLIRVVATVGIVAALPSFAAAQGSDDLRIRRFASPGYEGEGMPYRDCSGDLDVYEAEEEEETSGAPFERETTTASGLSVEEAQQIRIERQRLLGEQINQFNELLQTMPATYPNRPEILFRKAEALRELADADYLVARAEFNECISNWYECISDAECYEPLPDYVEAIAEYQSIARNHATYARLDEVIFRLGETLMENDAAAEGIQYLTRLVSNYPESPYIPDARLLMAEHYFDNDLLLAARQNYEEVLNFPESSIYNYAMYKIGWIDINEELFEEALTKFQTVVANLDANPEDTLDFRNQALNDMLLAYAELDQGWQRAQQYYENLEGVDFMRRKLTSLANLYDERGFDESRVAVLEYFMDRFNMDPQMPQWASDMVDALGNIGIWDRTEAKTREFIAFFDPNGPWALQNQGETEQLRNARIYSENWLVAIITRNETEARRLSNPAVTTALWTEVAEDYDEFFERFPDSSDAYEFQFFFAEMLYYQMANSGDCAEHELEIGPEECERYLRKAGDEYREVVEMRPDPEAEHAHEAALGALQVYDGFMERTNPRVNDDLPAPRDFGEILDPFRNELGEVVPADLNDDAQNYVDIVSWFADLYPDDDSIPAASWRAASLYLYNGHVGEAAERFETIIEHHPNHRFAQNAGIAAFVCYNEVEDWERIESVARRLLESCEGDTDICDPASLQGAIAYAMNNQANDLMAASQTAASIGEVEEARGLSTQAAEISVALYREFPESEWSPQALSNAAAIYEQAREVDTSIELYEELLATYPDRTEYPTPETGLVPDAMYTLGLIHDNMADLETAASWFEQVDAFPQYEYRTEAVLAAGRLREAVSQYDDAIRLYRHYQTLEPTTEETKAIYFQIAAIERDRGNSDAAYDELQRFLDNVTGEPVRRLQAVYLQADIRREQDQMDAALARYDEVINMYGRGEPTFDEEADIFAGWLTPPGANYTDESQRLTVLPYVAEAVFWHAEQDYQTAKAADLTYRAGRQSELEEKLTARGDAIVAAQRSLSVADNMGDAQWAVAARTRIGQLYMDFYRDLYDIPPPDYDECLDLTRGDYDACDQMLEDFDGILYEYGSVLEDKAMASWIPAREAALSQGIYNEWTQVIITQMNDVDRTYRLGGAENVVADNTADPFVSTLYILDLSEKIAAFEDFVEEMPPTPCVEGTPNCVDGFLIDTSAPTLEQPSGATEMPMGETEMPAGATDTVEPAPAGE